MLNCSCSHNRLDHIGGDYTQDSVVLKCNFDGCNCSKYHAAKNNPDSYIYKSLAIALVFSLIGIGSFISICVGIDVMLQNYNIEKIKTEPETFLVYSNGTKVGDSNSSETFDVILFLKMFIGIILFFVFYIMGAIFIEPVFTRAKKDIINSK